MQSPNSYHFKAEQLAFALEMELKKRNRWDPEPIAEEKLENMGAFGENTMTFEQWIQFILIVRLRQMARQELDFPENSMLATYAIRRIGDDPQAEDLRDLLNDVDILVEEVHAPKLSYTSNSPTVTMGSTDIPDVLFTLSGTIPQLSIEDLESTLQTFDTFLGILSPEVRPRIVQLLQDAMSKSTEPALKERLQNAIASITNGGRVAEPYDHEEAMRKYQEMHRRDYPND